MKNAVLFMNCLDRIKEHKKDVEKEKHTSNVFVIPNKIIMYLILKILEFWIKAMCKVFDCN